jgi:O-antigen/teichoic acid export membrane protein
VLTAGTVARQATTLARRSLVLGPLAAASAASLLNSLAIAVVFARLGGADGYGMYQMALAATSIAGFLALSGSATAAMRAAAQGRKAAWPLFRARLPFCLAASGAVGATGVVVVLAGNRALGLAFCAAAATLPLFLGADVFPAQLVGERRYAVYFRFQLAVQTASALGVVAALVAAPGSPWLAVLAMTGLTGLLQLGGVLPQRRSGSAAAGDLSYARRMTGISVLSAVDTRLDVLLAGSLLGASQAGVVAVARIFPSLVKNLWLVLNQPFFTALASGTLAHGFSLARRYRVPLFAALAGASAVGAAVAPWAVPRIFGSEFHDSVGVAQLLLVGTALGVTVYLDHLLIRAQGDLRRDATIQILLALTSLVALPPLILLLGVYGVGVEAVLASAVYVAAVRYLAPGTVPRPVEA